MGYASSQMGHIYNLQNQIQRNLQVHDITENTTDKMLVMETNSTLYISASLSSILFIFSDDNTIKICSLLSKNFNRNILHS